MQLVLDTNGLSLKVRNGSFQVSGKEGKRMISPKMIEGIMVFSDCLISSDAIRLAIAERVPILFFDGVGGASGRIWSAEFDRLPQVRRNQVLFERDRPAASAWAAKLYRLKAETQLANIQAQDAKHPGIAEMQALLDAGLGAAFADAEKFEGAVMVWEAQVARHYWMAVSSLLPKGYSFKKRTRRPAEDMFNAALNYLYGMLYNTVEGAVFASGLDPFLGIVHADEYNKPTLVFDLIEPFRAWIDRMLIELCQKEALESRHFELEGNGVLLNKEGRRLLIPAYLSLMGSEIEWQGKQLSIKNHIFQYVGEFSSFLERYEPNNAPGTKIKNQKS